MSVKLSAEIKCDNCGNALLASHDRSTELCRPYAMVKHQAEQEGWVILYRGGPAKHFCPNCAERVPAGKFTRFTEEEKAKRRESRARHRHTREAKGFWSEENFQNEKWKYGL